MTNKELQAALSKHPDDMEVCLSVNEDMTMACDVVVEKRNDMKLYCKGDHVFDPQYGYEDLAGKNECLFIL